MKRLLIIFSVFTFLLFSCKKKNLSFTMAGKIKSLDTQQPLSGVKVKLYTYKMGSGVKELQKSATTNSKGDYNVTINRDRYEKVVLQTSYTNYFVDSKTFYFDDLSTEKNNTANFSVSPQSWTRFTIQTNEGDTLRIRKVSGKTDCDLCQPNGNYDFIGESTSFVWPNDGGSYMTFHYWINNDSIHVLDSVYNTPFDTVNYTINY